MLDNADIYSIMKHMNTTLNVKCRHCNVRQEIQVNYADLQAWKSGRLIQDAMPYLDADAREFLISQTCTVCFDKMCGVDMDE